MSTQQVAPGYCRDADGAQRPEAELMWDVLERIAPKLLPDMMYMGCVTNSAFSIMQYKHYDTRRYLNISTDGRCWHYYALNHHYVEISKDAALAWVTA